MPLKKDMNKDEICNYLETDLKKSISNDIKPIIQPHKKEGGYFGVPRLILCYIDYLGSLYGGYNGEVRNGRKLISTTHKAVDYIKEVLGKVDSLYEKYGNFLYEMYRHGTVHLYQPKTFINNLTNNTLSWVTYKGLRTEENKDYGKLEHMKPRKLDNTMQWILPISINVLYDDLITSINVFKVLIKNDYHLVDKWKQTANVIIENEETNLQWDI